MFGTVKLGWGIWKYVPCLEIFWIMQFGQRKNAEEGYVELTIQKVEQGHKITCINNYKTDPVQKNGRLVTTKGDAESHGIGICSVSDIVRNAGGILNYGTENEEFHVEIYLPKREGGSM